MSNIGKWNNQASSELIDQLIHQGVHYFCLAPGFRSTPLALAVSQNPHARFFIHFDERGLGFHALGYAKATGKPVAIIVTSGSAVGNLYPAVMEAFHDHLPLILLSADRPSELRNTKANQTCDQTKFFGNYVYFYSDLPAPDSQLPSRFFATTIAQAVWEAKKGPVHLNCAFREPFFDTQLFKTNETPCIYEESNVIVSPRIIQKWASFLNSAKNGAIVIGALHSSSYDPLLQLASKLKWPILSDILSGLRSLGKKESVISYFDFILKSRPDFKADVILYLGDQIVSKRLLQWISSPIFQVSLHQERCDPNHKVTNRVFCDPLYFCEQLLTCIPNRQTGWITEWKECEYQIEKAIQHFFIKEKTLSEPGLFASLSHQLPALFIGNSMPIRDANSLFFPSIETGRIFANRGLSGIDGNIATCAGIASHSPLIAIIGDQTAFHDLNSLAMLPKCPHPLTLIILNNGGGGIFSFVSTPPHLVENFFAASHEYTFEQAAALFNIPYAKVQQVDQLTSFFGKTCIIELQTNRSANVALHRALDTCIANAVTKQENFSHSF